MFNSSRNFPLIGYAIERICQSVMLIALNRPPGSTSIWRRVSPDAFRPDGRGLERGAIQSGDLRMALGGRGGQHS